MRIEQTHSLLPSSTSEDTHETHRQRRQDTFATLGRNTSDSVELTGSGNALRQIVESLHSALAVDLPAHPGIPADRLQPKQIAVPDPLELDQPESADRPSPAIEGTGDTESRKSQQTANNAPTGDQDLSEEEQREVQELKNRDREVRAHEQAHLAAAGPHATGGPTYEYQRGPDNRQYAVGGEVQIDTSPEKDPEATIRKAQTVRRAAQAPAEPSSQDRSVAAAAARLEAEARQELSQQRQEESRKDEATTSGSTSKESAAQTGVAERSGAEETRSKLPKILPHRRVQNGHSLDMLA